jgi:hypothetical protein
MSPVLLSLTVPDLTEGERLGWMELLPTQEKRMQKGK